MRYLLYILLILPITCLGQQVPPQTFTNGNATSKTYTKGQFMTDYLKVSNNRTVSPKFDSLNTVALVGGVWYWHNGSTWLQTAGGSATVDSLLFPTQYQLDTTRKHLYRAIDSAFEALDDSTYTVRMELGENLADTAAALRSSIPSTTSFVKYIDTGAMLAPYMRKNDSLLYQTKYRTDTMRSNIYAALDTKGPGTVTSIIAGVGLISNTITATGTIDIDTGMMATRLRVQKAIDSLNGIIGTKGTVSSVSAAPAFGLTWTGSPIITTGTLTPTFDTTNGFTTRGRHQKTADSISAIVATKGSGTVTSIGHTAGYGVTLTGTTNVTTTGTVTIAADTTKPNGLSTIAWRQKLADSIGVALGNYTTWSTVNTQSGTTYTLQSSDRGKVVACTNSSAVTVTVPSGLGSSFYCTISQEGSGQVTISAGSGVIIHNRQSFTKTAGQYSAASIRFTQTTDTYNTQGDMQ